MSSYNVITGHHCSFHLIGQLSYICPRIDVIKAPKKNYHLQVLLKVPILNFDQMQILYFFAQAHNSKTTIFNKHFPSHISTTVQRIFINLTFLKSLRKFLSFLNVLRRKMRKKTVTKALQSYSFYLDES